MSDPTTARAKPPAPPNTFRAAFETLQSLVEGLHADAARARAEGEEATAAGKGLEAAGHLARGEAYLDAATRIMKALGFGDPR